MEKVTEIVARLAEPVINELGCELWDVEYVKEAGSFYLRLYIDKDGGVSIDDCERVSRAMDKVLDEADPVETSYIFEVSSAGAERQLKRPENFERFMGSAVVLRLYVPKNGQKEYSGTLAGYKDGDVTIQTPSGTLEFQKNEVALVRLSIDNYLNGETIE